jgi:hypothetical protein
MKKKLKKTLYGRTSHAYESAESILWNCLHCGTQSTYPMKYHQNLKDILHRDRKNNPKVHMEVQKTLNGQGNANQIEQHCITIPDFKLLYRAIVIQTTCSCHRNRHKDNATSRLEDLDTNPCRYNHLILGAQNMCRWKKIASSTNVTGKTGYLHVEGWNLIPISHLH